MDRRPEHARVLGTGSCATRTRRPRHRRFREFRAFRADNINVLQEQLGLKLEATKGPVKTIVIDHAEKPSAN